MSGMDRDEAEAADVFDAACYRCGSEEDLVEDGTFEGLLICRPCLERVEAQNEMIERGLEDEPEVAP
ncbi:MAG: hypothetical protein KY397_03800 [Gemmatimonadetes bacterium]|nr:hypothetical protein [Gemmatimonadota bacterium]